MSQYTLRTTRIGLHVGLSVDFWRFNTFECTCEKYLKSQGKVGKFDEDWRVSTLVHGKAVNESEMERSGK